MSYAEQYTEEYLKDFEPKAIKKAKKVAAMWSTDNYSQEEKDAVLGRDYVLPGPIEDKVDELPIGKEEKAEAKRIAYRLYDNLANGIFAFNHELYIHTARDEYVESVGDDRQFRPVVQFICEYTLGRPLESITKILKY